LLISDLLVIFSTFNFVFLHDVNYIIYIIYKIHLNVDFPCKFNKFFVKINLQNLHIVK